MVVHGNPGVLPTSFWGASLVLRPDVSAGVAIRFQTTNDCLLAKVARQSFTKAALGRACREQFTNREQVRTGHTEHIALTGAGVQRDIGQAAWGGMAVA